MPGSLAWIADAWRGTNLNASDLYITCARGLTPQQLAERMSDHQPAEIGDALTGREASALVDLSQTYCVGRLGQSGDWSFIVESGGSEGWALDPAVSGDGAEILIFDPRPDDPPSFFRYLADGELQLHCELGAGYYPSGAQPDLLRPALEAAGVIAPEDSLDDLLDDEELAPLEAKRKTLEVIGEHFGLDLPQQTIEHGQLPSVVTRTSPPSSW
ncbi:DUF6461 domain-containing protein [Streptomyces sp. PanSC9]|uniref:DUF6461 domain-containing protein n=1 Tax=Streptomyces sp. PanSC9 TaxID=1520461 RepID=UPI000F4A0AF6|nr:DUF6461 domain-containing protein [Streptomyces sp. PanSC9]ROP44223.1 hypothetical protein EDD94_8011 [Streptomyces sp. PanSC9]